MRRRAVSTIISPAPDTRSRTEELIDFVGRTAENHEQKLKRRFSWMAVTSQSKDSARLAGCTVWWTMWLYALGASGSAYELSDHPRIFVNKAGLKDLAEKARDR